MNVLSDPAYDLPVPNVVPVADDDLSWTVRVNLDQLALFFENPARWMAALSLAAGRELRLANDYTVSLRPAVAEGGAPPGDPADRLRAFAQAEGLAAEDLAAYPSVVVTGIDDTSIVTVMPSAVATDIGLRTRPEWDAYWDEWTDDERTPLQMSILTDDRVCYGHWQISKEGDPDVGNRIAAYMLLASSDVGRMNRLLAKRPNSPGLVNVVPADDPRAQAIKEARKPFLPVDAETLAGISFLLAAEQTLGPLGNAVGDAVPAAMTCTLDDGHWDPANQQPVLVGTTLKFYGRTTPPGPSREAA